MWNLKKQNKQNKTKNKLIDIENRLLVTGGKLAKGWEKWVKGVNGLVKNGNQTCGGDHFVVYTDVEF